jgi:hypothetical protein
LSIEEAKVFPEVVLELADSPKTRVEKDVTNRAATTNGKSRLKDVPTTLSTFTSVIVPEQLDHLKDPDFKCIATKCGY